MTLLHPDRPPGTRRSSSTLPPDLLEQVRGRVRLLALLLFVIFAFEPFLDLIVWIVGAVGGIPTGLFLCRYGEDFDFVKVLDFGLVKARGEPAGGPRSPARTSFRALPLYCAGAGAR
ncbi:MAG: hypothetical protein ACREL3_00605 [Gemmatimonadales bacterium]